VANSIVVIAMLAWTAFLALSNYKNVDQIRKPGLLILILLVFQVCLGGTAFYTRVVQGHEALQPQLPMVISTVAHVGVGALLLATTVIFTIRVCLIGLQPTKIGIKLMPNRDITGGSRHEHIVPGNNRERVGWLVDRSLLMSSQGKTYVKFGAATLLILFLLGYLAYTGVQDSKSYYVTISELHKMGNGAYSKRLRVAGNVQLGSIKRTGTHVQFVLVEQDQLLSVDYTGTEAPPDTFKDDSQALADGSFGRDGVFHAKALQAKCASKYAPQQPGKPMQAEPAKSMTQVQTGSQPTAASN
jgi:cytochrome c-type biogenesis protein CcmE